MRYFEESNSYVPQEAHLVGSFRINLATTPDDLRDGNSNMLLSVTRVSAGLFTVTFDPTCRPIPEKDVSIDAWLMPIDVTPVAIVVGALADSWNPTTKSFQIICSAAATGVATDPEDNSRICFEVLGSISPVGKD